MRPSALLVAAIMSLSAEPSHAQPARDARPLYAAEIRARLDDDTILLEYALGEQRSFLWVGTPDALQTFELPGRAEIEERLEDHPAQFGGSA